MGKALSADDIRAASDLEITRVEVPEWGGDVFLRRLTLDQVLKAQERTRKEKDGGQFGLAVLCMCLCGEDGKPLFGADDLDVLRGKSARAIERLTREATRINGLDLEAAEAAQENFEPAPNGDSFSA